MEQPFEIISERVREYRRFNASGTQITARLKPPSIVEPEAESDLEASPVSEPEAQSENEPEPKSSSVYDPVNHFLDSVNALFNYALENVRASDMVGVTIRNEDNQADKAIGFSFRRRDQIAGDVIWSLFEQVSQSNARFNALDKLVVEVQVVKMPVGFGRNKNALTTKGRPVSELAHLKRSIVRVEAEENCLALDEVRLAVSKGYRIVKVYEVYEYAVTQYDRQGDEGGLFVEYINTFLKLKAEASGYPVWVSSSEDEDRFINAFYMSEGILLDKNEIRPNAAKRALAKLCLNSFWGKLTEKNNRTKSKMITDPRELYRFLVTPGIEVVNLMFASDQVCWASWRYAEDEKIPNLRHTNEVIGAYVTTGARIHLYKYLDNLQERALYCDTDSVLYIQDDDKPALIQCGDNLGDMTNELKPNEFIHEFVSGGPKNYAYKISNTDASKEPKTVCKVRGITLNYTAIQVVKFDVLKQMILRGEPDVVMVHTEKKIKRKRKLEGCVSIITEPEDKKYRISFFKRRRLADNTSLPFGYK